MSDKIKSKFFYGYWIVVAGFFTVMLHSGLGFYSFSVLNKPIADEFVWSRSEVTAAFLFYALTAAIVSPLVGRLIDKRGPRQVLLIGAITTPLTLILLSQTSALWNFYLLHICIGAALAFQGLAPISINISNWFYRLRGTMQGFAFTGIGVGGMILAPLLGNYIIPNLGWRGAYVIMASMSLVIMLLLLLFVVKDDPSQKGLYPYGQEDVEVPDDNAAETKEAAGLSFRESIGTISFWTIALTSLIYGASHTAALQNQVSILTSQSFTATAAVASLGGVGFFSAAGKLFFGYLCDRTDPKYAAAISYLFTGLSLVAITEASSMAVLWVYTALMGLGTGGWAPNLSMLSSKYFDPKYFGSVLGALHMFFLAGTAMGPLLASFVYDQTGSYHYVLLVLAALCLLSIPTIILTRRPRAV